MYVLKTHPFGNVPFKQAIKIHMLKKRNVANLYLEILICLFNFFFWLEDRMIPDV